jgi:hypothetical protein
MAKFNLAIRVSRSVLVLRDVFTAKVRGGSVESHGETLALRSHPRQPSQRYPRFERKPGWQRVIAGNSGDSGVAERAGRPGSRAGILVCRSLAPSARRSLVMRKAGIAMRGRLTPTAARLRRDLASTARSRRAGGTLTASTGRGTIG